MNVTSRIVGDYKIEFAMPQNYDDELKRSNSIIINCVRCKKLVDKKLQFTHFYVNFNILKQEMLSRYRKIIGLHRAFLK